MATETIGTATGGSRDGQPHKTWTVVLAALGVVASGTNSMLREFGGVCGIAVLASVFARQGVYHSPHVFVAGFTQALSVGAGFSVIGVFAAAFMPRHRRPGEAPAPDGALTSRSPIQAAGINR